MTGGKANLAASIHQRLLNEARRTARPFSELLQYFAMERFLYRLSCSPHASRLMLKGGLMLASWRVAITRPTKDIDLLAAMSNDVGGMEEVIRDVCGIAVPPDGMTFDATSVAGERIAEEAEYGGVRIAFGGQLGSARVFMQIDAGFGDAVVPGPVQVDYPAILDLPAPVLRGYTRESAIAEKFHAMVLRGLLNSRMRDFFDVWALSRQFEFDGPQLSAAVRATFARRGLEVPARPVALTEEFATDAGKAQQWAGFLRNSRLSNAPESLVPVVSHLGTFLGPVADALHAQIPFPRHWGPPGPWSQD